MPIPIPPALDETTQSSLATEHNTTSTSTNTTNPSFSSSSTSQSDDDRPLSKEEADRLYEERMEEEYAKREGEARMHIYSGLVLFALILKTLATASPDASDGPLPQPGLRDPRPNLATHTITIPEIQIPTSVELVLRTALPTSYLSQLTDPSARASLISEIRDGFCPEWYSTLPADVKHFFSTAYTAADLCHKKSRGGVPAPAPTGLGPGAMGVAAVMGVVNAL
ncbi:hypothetical protein BO82DRAFT_430166 [Aspergillus uvarum CBS 121591]|uniref:Uncharacterized protein n=1 Tax=Aspergillus uvarum CBS 121591 TaxID=1448315 RepID=A0A319CF51_9EURO|nr:hypothetical protein BO82DRAFT_430166 [Aspergillus uvarum CBS 121591]PYH84476.1 hypothetical protein BO82DRAFT_430166 [Aspergillus uvarum CBS 121591]